MDLLILVSSSSEGSIFFNPCSGFAPTSSAPSSDLVFCSSVAVLTLELQVINVPHS